MVKINKVSNSSSDRSSRYEKKCISSKSRGSSYKEEKNVAVDKKKRESILCDGNENVRSSSWKTNSAKRIKVLDNQIVNIKVNKECSKHNVTGLISKPTLLKEKVQDGKITSMPHSIASKPQENPNRKMTLSERQQENLTKLIFCKSERTKVYSGQKKMVESTNVPTLFGLCTNVIQKNLELLNNITGVPYSLIKPILEKMTPEQLLKVECQKPYIRKESSELWKFHVQKHFQDERKGVMESWREMYMRCKNERERKLKDVMKIVKRSQDNCVPVRQINMAYVDTKLKPPPNVARIQSKNKKIVHFKTPLITPSMRMHALETTCTLGNISLPNENIRRRIVNSTPKASLPSKKAPLLAKSMQMMKMIKMRMKR
ncbi:PREDICTED: transcription elongation factor B polypeptide 3-like [Nicrophorus vespilloides]|uniref:Transcription elongation factor B polypeptide 3-like n=1 Tax=Nicrophorus vespilloides TaxID=110193 RepID=A0ABM1NH48_NICVS|nr:PREDICTED: transcription elongation factor B polypeptide 3-like [Nicrophorus vespilloides]